MPKSKLYRNLKPGDKFSVIDSTSGSTRTAIVTVSSVKETIKGWFSGKRQWVVYGNYPWWFSNPVVAYSDDRVDLVLGDK